MGVLRGHNHRMSTADLTHLGYVRHAPTKLSVYTLPTESMSLTTPILSSAISPAVLRLVDCTATIKDYRGCRCTCTLTSVSV